MKLNRPKQSLFIGRKPVLEALMEGGRVEKIFLLRSATGEDIHEIKKLARSREVPVALVPVEKLNGFSRANHQGIVALAGQVDYVALQDAISQVVDTGATPLFVLLDGVTDVRNIGAIARTALCCGAQLLILPTSHTAALNEDAMKASAGALSRIMISRTPSVADALKQLQLNGIQTFATQMKGSIRAQDADLSIPACIVMGDEGSGISKDVLRYADHMVRIPMPGGFESLNVSVAAGMLLYEAVRQRGA